MCTTRSPPLTGSTSSSASGGPGSKASILASPVRANNRPIRVDRSLAPAIRPDLAHPWSSPWTRTGAPVCRLIAAAPPAWSGCTWVSTMRVTSRGCLPIAARPATIRAGARFSPVSTSVTLPSSCTRANELIRSLPAVGIRKIPGASGTAGVEAMAGAYETSSSARARSSPVCPVSTTTSGSPIRSAAARARARSSSSGCCASQTIRV